MIKTARIGRLSDGKWRVYSRKGRNLGTYDTYSAAKKRLAEVEMFKAMKEKKASAATFSAVMRQLQLDHPHLVEKFLTAFKQAFDEAVEEDLEDLESAALLEAVHAIQQP